MDADSSVRSVSRERWLEAQTWERELWESSAQRTGWRRFAWPVLKPVLRAVGWKRAWGDDWNYWWAERFDHYSFLPEDLGDYIEVGCGPYTNTRLIMHERHARRVVCSDPLADTYLQLSDRWLSMAHRKGLVEVDNHPIEELPFEPGSFDVVVMNNVLDHVRDADLCLERALALLRPGVSSSSARTSATTRTSSSIRTTSVTRSVSRGRTSTGTWRTSRSCCARTSRAKKAATRGCTTRR